MSSDYPTSDSFGILSTGDPEEDRRQLDLCVLREKRQIEGICPNGCAPMILDDPYNRHCPTCGFTGHSNVPFPVVGAPDLHVYGDGEYVVIATSPADAVAIVAEEVLIDAEDLGTFEAVPEDQLLTLHAEDPETNPDLPTEAETKTCAEWVRLQGRGYLGGPGPFEC